MYLDGCKMQWLQSQIIIMWIVALLNASKTDHNSDKNVKHSTGMVWVLTH